MKTGRLNVSIGKAIVQAADEVLQVNLLINFQLTQFKVVLALL